MSPALDTRRTSDRMLPEDWDLIFDAVVWRLRQHACTAAPARVRAAVEDCVQSLDMLHAELAQDRGHMRCIELELRQTRAELTAAKAELAGAGEARPRQLAGHDDGQPTRPNRSSSAAG